MPTVHDEIDNYLAADVHNELSNEERYDLHAHLVECADCRRLHQETKIMNNALEETLAGEKPDIAFEQRMLAAFRNRVPQKAGRTTTLIVDLMRLRATQITAIAAVLLALVQVGRMITGEGTTAPRNREYATQEQFAAQPAQALLPSSNDIGALSKSAIRQDRKTDRLAAGQSLAGPQKAAALAESQTEAKDEKQKPDEVDRTIAAGSTIPAAKEVGRNPAETPVPALANRKLIRNAKVELEIVRFDDAIQEITTFANEERGYVATSSSEKQANGKLKGEIVVRVLPENLDHFLQKIRVLGELKNQTLGTEDVTKAYFDTDSRLKNARVMEQRMIDMLKKKSDDINDLLQVEKELGRVREQIEQMQGDLKYWDSQVQFATVTIQLTEKDMEEPAKFLLKERAQLALYAPDVEKIYNDIKALASPKTQITNAQLDRDNTGRVSARASVLIAPEESDAQIARVKTMGRVENFQVQTERVAQGGTGMSENARTKRDKVELNITISREEQEHALQQTSLRICTSSVDEKTKELRGLAEKQNGRVRSSSFSRDPDGREFANVSLRVPMKDYNALMQSLTTLGKVENVSVQRQDRTGAQVDETNAPADLSIQVYSQGNIVSQETGLFATLRRTLGQSAAAIMWSLRMIGVALAFLAPWAIALAAIIWVARRVVRARAGRSD
jgi:anti-sigma factor RsiW